MKRQTIIFGTILALSVAAPAAAMARPGFATTDVHMRAGPSTGFPAITTVNGGARVQIHGCLDSYNWCDVSWRGERGWIYARYLQFTYHHRRVRLPLYGARVDLPVIGFSVGTYWRHHYRHRHFYSRRDYWRHRYDRRHGQHHYGRNEHHQRYEHHGRNQHHERHGHNEHRALRHHAVPAHGIFRENLGRNRHHERDARHENHGHRGRRDHNHRAERHHRSGGHEQHAHELRAHEDHAHARHAEQEHHSDNGVTLKIGPSGVSMH